MKKVVWLKKKKKKFSPESIKNFEMAKIEFHSIGKVAFEKSDHYRQ